MRINDIEYIEVDVLDVRSAAHASEAFSLILTDKFNATRYVPIIIGLNEARAILGEKHGRLPQRPLTHTLFADLLTDHIPDYNLEFVSIDDFHDGIYYASIVIQSPTGVYFNVDARPSDAVAIALHAKLPVFFRKELFEELLQVARNADEYETDAEFGGFPTPGQPNAPTAETEWETMSLSELKDLLQNAIDEENYEMAAKIQEEIDKRGA
ncbi:MAG: bifunctional nuclease family protein [Bacteroidales bacterium]|nr:bifunctional nuclease family protein [Bacteroidales bacterium]